MNAGDIGADKIAPGQTRLVYDKNDNIVGLMGGTRR